VEISRYFIDIYTSCKSATFLSLKSLNCLLKIIMIIYVSFMMIPGLNYRTLFINSIFHKVSIEVNNMGAHYILNIKRKNVTRNVREIDIKIDRKLR